METREANSSVLWFVEHFMACKCDKLTMIQLLGLQTGGKHALLEGK